MKLTIDEVTFENLQEIIPDRDTLGDLLGDLQLHVACCDEGAHCDADSAFQAGFLAAAQGIDHVTLVDDNGEVLWIIGGSLESLCRTLKKS